MTLAPGGANASFFHAVGGGSHGAGDVKFEALHIALSADRRFGPECVCVQVIMMLSGLMPVCCWMMARISFTMSMRNPMMSHTNG